MKVVFDLRTYDGLLACAFHVLRQYGRSPTTRSGDSRRDSRDIFLARFARRTSLALIYLVRTVGGLPRERWTEFWREYVLLAQGGEPQPLDWRRAVELLRHEHEDLLPGLLGEGDVEHTSRLFDAALRMIREPPELEDKRPVETLGLVLLEIAEFRCTRFHIREQRQFTDLRRALRDSPDYGAVRVLHDAFSFFVGSRNATESQRNFSGSNWRPSRGDGARVGVRATGGRITLPGEKSPSKLNSGVEDLAGVHG